MSRRHLPSAAAVLLLLAACAGNALARCDASFVRQLLQAANASSVGNDTACPPATCLATPPPEVLDPSQMQSMLGAVLSNWSCEFFDGC